MIISDLGRAAVTIAVPLLAWTSMLTTSYLYSAAFLLGALAVIFILAYRAYLPTLVSPGALLAANSRLQATESLSDLAGPGLAGLLTQLMGARCPLTSLRLTLVRSAMKQTTTGSKADVASR